MTLFSEAKYKFLEIKEGDDIPTDPFLLAADEIVPFFGEKVLTCRSNLLIMSIANK